MSKWLRNLHTNSLEAHIQIVNKAAPPFTQQPLKGTFPKAFTLMLKNDG